MSTGLDMSLDDMIAKNRKSRGSGPARGSGSGSGPIRRNNPNRKSNRSAPYQSAKVQIRSSLLVVLLSSQICPGKAYSSLNKAKSILVNLSKEQTDWFDCIGAGVHLGTRHVLRWLTSFPFPFFRRNRNRDEALHLQFGLRRHERWHQGIKTRSFCN